MKRRVITVLLCLALVLILALGGRLLFRVFVTDRITDKGGMENPWAVEEAEEGSSEEEFEKTEDGSSEEITENTDKES